MGFQRAIPLFENGDTAMSEKVVVGPVLSPDWLEKRRNILGEIDRQLIVGLKEPGKGLTLDQLQLVIEHHNPFESRESLLADWVRFFREVFGIYFYPSGIKIPPEKQGFGWLVVMLEGMTSRRLFDKCRGLFGASKNPDKSLDEVTSDRYGDYVVWFRDRVEADDELKNRSANDLKEAGIQGITLEERLMLELFYWWKTKKHLDLRDLTLCSGSCYSDGYVPGVYWDGGDDELNVRWYHPDNRHLRSRQAVV